MGASEGHWASAIDVATVAVARPTIGRQQPLTSKRLSKRLSNSSTALRHMCGALYHMYHNTHGVSHLHARSTT